MSVISTPDKCKFVVISDTCNFISDVWNLFYTVHIVISVLKFVLVRYQSFLPHPFIPNTEICTEYWSWAYTTCNQFCRSTGNAWTNLISTQGSRRIRVCGSTSPFLFILKLLIISQKKTLFMFWPLLICTL